MEEINKSIITSLFNDYINQWRLEELHEIIHEDYLDLVTGKRGIKAYQDNVAAVLNGFPGLKFDIKVILAEGDVVSIRWQWIGDHRGHFNGIAPTNKTIQNTGMVMYTLKDRKIIDSYAMVDRIGVLQQMGFQILPA